MTREHNIGFRSELHERVTFQEMLKIDNWTFSFPFDLTNHKVEKHFQQLIMTNNNTGDQYSVIMYIKTSMIPDNYSIRIESDCCYEESTCFTLNKLVEHMNSKH